MATYTPKRLVDPVQLTTSSAASLYTVAASGVTTVIKEVLITNPTASAVAATVYLVPSGGSAGNSNAIVPAVLIPANSTLKLPLSTVMNANDAIRALAASGSSITLIISGVEITA